MCIKTVDGKAKPTREAPPTPPLTGDIESDCEGTRDCSIFRTAQFSPTANVTRVCHEVAGGNP